MKLNKRRFKKLRISLTNQCNMACSYCVPEKYVHQQTVPDIISLGSSTQHKKRLHTKDLLNIVEQLHSELSLNQVRFTGGEPLLHQELPAFISATKKLGIENIGLTSNGFLLPIKARELKNAGLQSINISIDSLNADTFRSITKKDYLTRVLQGIDKALEVGLNVKLNSVIMRNVNNQDVRALLNYAIGKGITIRFIELMKMGHLYNSDNSLYYSAHEILTDIEQEHQIEVHPREHSSTARYWNTDNGGKFGIIANETFPFCSDCDRLRLDEYGSIYGCISSNDGFDLSQHVSNSAKLKEQLTKALSTKQAVRFKGSTRNMITVGG